MPHCFVALCDFRARSIHGSGIARRFISATVIFNEAGSDFNFLDARSTQSNYLRIGRRSDSHLIKDRNEVVKNLSTANSQPTRRHRQCRRRDRSCRIHPTRLISACDDLQMVWLPLPSLHFLVSKLFLLNFARVRICLPMRFTLPLRPEIYPALPPRSLTEPTFMLDVLAAVAVTPIRLPVASIPEQSHVALRRDAMVNHVGGPTTSTSTPFISW
jgi:hypothetical protein